MADEKKPRYWHFTPEGWPVENVMTRGWQSAIIDSCGPATSEIEYSSGDYPEMELWGDGVSVVCDEDASDWLMHHCRLVEIPENFDISKAGRYAWVDGQQVDTEPRVEPWPEELCEACGKAPSLHDVLTSYNEALRWLPTRFKTDTFEIVMERFLLGPVKAEIAGIEAMVAAHRAKHPDITKLEEPDDAET